MAVKPETEVQILLLLLMCYASSSKLPHLSGLNSLISKMGDNSTYLAGLSADKTKLYLQKGWGQGEGARPSSEAHNVKREQSHRNQDK
jgi:hypothetical protein